MLYYTELLINDGDVMHEQTDNCFCHTGEYYEAHDEFIIESLSRIVCWVSHY